jgi:hypothetical protein
MIELVMMINDPNVINDFPILKKSPYFIRKLYFNNINNFCLVLYFVVRDLLDFHVRGVVSLQDGKAVIVGSEGGVRRLRNVPRIMSFLTSLPRSKTTYV